MTSVKTLVNFVRKSEQARRGERPRTNDRGNSIYRTHLSSERYVVDFSEDFGAEGWQQFDTDQDANYFGVWVNPTKRLTLTYAEGDWTLVECPDVACYNAEIRKMCEVFGEGFIAKGVDIDAGTVTEYRQDRSKFLIAE